MPLVGEYEPSTSEWARSQAETFESSGGSDANTMRDKPIIVITTRGAKSGKLRKTALMRVEHEGEYAVIASKGGTPENPAWYFNIVAESLVELQDGDVKRDYRAHVAEGPERALWWERSVAAWPDYASYQEKTERVIPVIVLTPLAA